MILKELFNTLTERHGGHRLALGDSGRSVEGLALDEDAEGWLGLDEVVVTGRNKLDARFLAAVSEGGAPAVVWRAEGEPSEQTVKNAEELGLGLLAISPGVPRRELFSLFARDAEGVALLRYSHGAARALLESVGGEASVAKLAGRVADLLGRSVVVEDPVGRLIAGSDPAGAKDGGGSQALISVLEAHELRASKGSGVEETRRERRDRYARLPDGFLSVPVERWRVEKTELFWTPIGTGAPAGYLWIDLAGSPLRPDDVVILYWAARALEAELGKERVRLETELGVRGDFVDDVVNSHHGSVDLLLQRARYLGADLSSGALSVIVDIDDFAGYLSRRKLKESAIQELKRRLTDAVRLQARTLLELPARSTLGQRHSVSGCVPRCHAGRAPGEGPEPCLPRPALRQRPLAGPHGLGRRRAVQGGPGYAFRGVFGGRGGFGDRAPHTRPLLRLHLRADGHLQPSFPCLAGGARGARVLLRGDPGARSLLRLPLWHGAHLHLDDLPRQRCLYRQDRLGPVRSPPHHPLPPRPRQGAHPPRRGQERGPRTPHLGHKGHAAPRARPREARELHRPLRRSLPYYWDNPATLSGPDVCTSGQ